MPDPSRLLLEAKGVSLVTPGGRTLMRDLELVLEGDHVAIVGRNGVGKSALLAVLAGREQPQRGEILSHSDRLLVPQDLGPDAEGLSRGELRKRHLVAARERQPGLLMLDEPTEDLDVIAIDWLCEWLAAYPGGLLVVSHHRQLLLHFHHFFVVAESGCRYFRGSFEELEVELDKRGDEEQEKYLRKLNLLVERERHDATLRRRRRRKRNLGRLHEERRAPSRAQLHGKKGYAQTSQAKAAKIRETRIEGVRKWVQAARRALDVRLPLELVVPVLPATDGRDLIALDNLCIAMGERELLSGLDLRLKRDRLGVVGPNGSGKSTLLRVMRGDERPTSGMVRLQHGRIGGIAQGAVDWLSEDSLVEQLALASVEPSAESIAQLVIAHKFPLGLAERPLRSLSEGERARAALICLYQSAPELLVLDEPTYSLDFAGVAALVSSLRRWPGGLVVASHDRAFLRAIGITRCMELDGSGGHRMVAPSAAPPRRSP